jgi:hypothetical protein
MHRHTLTALIALALCAPALAMTACGDDDGE